MKKTIDLNDLIITCSQHKYKASDGYEIFLSLEDTTQDVLIGYLRLREIALPHRYELQKESCMIIRELKVLGRELSIGEKTSEALQHRGYGKELMREAERICFEEFDNLR